MVDLVFDHMRTRPVGESLGVVALSRIQADLISRIIDERRITERDVDERFGEDSEEPFFVKNLENVQGDERDRMIICIGYGPTVGSGAVPNRFGPINQSGGERRLNVVVTRAKKRVDIVHSLRASDIRSQQNGPRLLRRYLEYASNPTAAFEGEVTIDDSAEADSPFEIAVEKALVAKGYRVARQIGVSGYRIDLAILSEDGQECELGIECDGWSYHSSPAARDRDWLRQKVLEGLGWTIHRVWSTAWVRNPATEMTRIEAALNTARIGAISTESSPEMNPQKKNVQTISPEEALRLVGEKWDSLTSTERINRVQQIGLDNNLVNYEWENIPENLRDKLSDASSNIEIAIPSNIQEIQLAKYQKAYLSRPNSRELRNETSGYLAGIIIRIAEIEGPVHNDVIIERIRLLYGIGKVKGSTRDKVERAILSSRQQNLILGDGTFIWLKKEQLNREMRCPPDNNIEHIPPVELRAIVLAVTKALFGLRRQALITEVTRTLGFNRSGGRITDLLGNTIQELLNEGHLVESFELIHIAT